MFRKEWASNVCSVFQLQYGTFLGGAHKFFSFYAVLERLIVQEPEAYYLEDPRNPESLKIYTFFENPRNLHKGPKEKKNNGQWPRCFFWKKLL